MRQKAGAAARNNERQVHVPRKNEGAPTFLFQERVSERKELAELAMVG